MKKFNFSVNYVQYLNEKGEVTAPLPAWTKDKELLISCYQNMVLTRTFDAKAYALQRTGKLGTFPSSLGQEAIFAAVGKAMSENDIYAPYYRDQGALFQRGLRPRDLFAYWGGDERGSSVPTANKDFPLTVPIASQCLHGTGAAYAIKLRNEKRAVVTLIGEGGTSEGAFYEAINFAGTHLLPIIFVINNNQWAISVPTALQSQVETFAQKAIAAGMTGVQVDGNDIIALYDTIHTGLQNAYSGQGPLLVEAITYRLCDHTTADDAKRYVPSSELDQAWNYEPIKRLESYLLQQNCLTEKQIDEIKENCRKQIEAEVEAYEAMPKQPVTAMWDYLYEKLPTAYADQYQELETWQK